MAVEWTSEDFNGLFRENRVRGASTCGGVVLHLDAVPSLKKADNIANIGVVAAQAPWILGKGFFGRGYPRPRSYKCSF